MMISVAQKAVEAGVKEVPAMQEVPAMNAEQVSFKSTVEYCNKQNYYHANLARSYERKANDLETKIRRSQHKVKSGEISQSTIKQWEAQVREYRKKAESEKCEARRWERKARNTLNPSFRGSDAEMMRAEQPALDKSKETKNRILSMDEAVNRRYGGDVSFGLGPCSRACVRSRVNSGYCFHS